MSGNQLDIVDISGLLSVSYNETSSQATVSVLGSPSTTIGHGDIDADPDKGVTLKNVSLSTDIVPALQLLVDKIILSPMGVLMECVIKGVAIDVSVDVNSKVMTFKLTSGSVIHNVLQDLIPGNVADVTNYINIWQVILTITGDSVISARVNGLIMGDEVTAYLGMHPDRYLSFSVPEFSITGHLNVGTIGNIKLLDSRATVLIQGDNVKIGSITYRKGITMSTNVDLSDVDDTDPYGKLLKIILGDSTYGKVSVRDLTNWYMEYRRTESDNLIEEPNFSMGVNSIGFRLERIGATYKVRIDIDGRLTLSDIPSLVNGDSITSIAIRARADISYNAGTFTIGGDIQLYEPLNIYREDIVVESFSMSVSGGTISLANISLDKIIKEMMPTKIDVNAAISAWDTSIHGNLQLDIDNKKVGTLVEVEDPLGFIPSILDLEDDNVLDTLMDLVSIDHLYVAYSTHNGYNAWGDTYNKGISLGGSFSMSLPNIGYGGFPTNGTPQDQGAYVLSAMIRSMAGPLISSGSLVIDANIQPKDPRLSSIEMKALLTYTTVHNNLGLSISKVGAGIRATGSPSIGAVAELGIVRTGYPDVIFKVYLTASATGVTIAINMLGEWQEIFGLDFLSVANLGASATKTYSDIASQLATLAGGVSAPAALAVFIPSTVGLIGTILIGPVDLYDEDGKRIPPLKLTAGFNIGTDVSNSAVLVDLDTSVYNSMAKFIEPFFLRITSGTSLPSEVSDILGILELDTAKMVAAPAGATIGGLTIDTGIGFDFLGRIVGAPEIEGDLVMIGSLSLGRGFYFRAELPVIDIPHLIKITGMKNSPNAILEIDVSTVSPLSSRIYADAMITVLDTFTRGVYMDISSKHIDMTAMDAIGTSRIEYGFKLGIEQPSLSAEVSINNPMGAIGEAIDGALNTIIDDILDAAAGKISTGLNNYIVNANNKYDKLMDDYSDYDITGIDSMITKTESSIMSILNGGLSSIKNIYTDIANKTISKNNAQSNYDKKKKELDNSMKSKNYSGGVQNVQKEIDRKNKAKREKERERAQAQTAKQRELDRINKHFDKKIKAIVDSVGWFWGAIPIGTLETARTAAIGFVKASGWIRKHVTNIVNACTSAINSLRSALDWLINNIRNAWNTVVNALTSAAEVLSAAISNAGGLSKILGDAKNNISKIISHLHDLVRLKLIRTVGLATPISIKTLTNSTISLPILSVISSNISAIESVASILKIKIPFVFELGQILTSLKTSISNAATGAKIPADVYNPRIEDIENEISTLDTDMSNLYDKMKKAEGSTLVQYEKDYHAMHSKRDDLQDELNNAKDSISNIQLHEPVEDIVLTVKDIAAMIIGGQDAVTTIILNILADNLKVVSNATNMASYYISHGPTMHDIKSSVLSDGATNTITVGGITIPTIGSVVRWVANNMNVHDLKLRGELSLENQYIEVVDGATFTLDGKVYDIPGIRVDFLDLIISLVKAIIDWVVGLL